MVEYINKNIYYLNNIDNDNIDDFILEMKKNNFKLIEKKNFLEYKKEEQKILDEDDKTFIDFYCSLIFTKK